MLRLGSLYDILITMKLVNITKNIILAESIELADNPWKRFKGLLGREGLPDGSGLYITPCNSIHSFFMRFSFDAIFIDKKNMIIDIIEEMPPGKIKYCFSAHSVIEIPPQIINKTETRIGDIISFLKPV